MGWRLSGWCAWILCMPPTYVENMKMDIDVSMKINMDVSMDLSIKWKLKKSKMSMSMKMSIKMRMKMNMYIQKRCDALSRPFPLVDPPRCNESPSQSYPT